MRANISFLGIVLALALAVVASRASGRETFHDLDVRTAAASSVGRARLLDVAFYMKGQAHPAVAQDLGEYRSNRRTNAFNKSDQEACEIAFLSAVIVFQKRAKAMGGNAVVDLKSITKGKELESATQYRCIAGNVVANVALSGRVVRFKKYSNVHPSFRAILALIGRDRLSGARESQRWNAGYR